MVARRGAFILPAEQPTTPQNRHDMLDKSLCARGFHVWHDVKPVDRTCKEPFCNRIGQLFGAADNESMPGNHTVQQLTHCESLAPRQVQYNIACSLGAGRSLLGI